MKVVVCDDNLYGAKTSWGCGVGGDHSYKLILEHSLDAGTFQYAFEKVRLDNVAGVNDREILVKHFLDVSCVKNTSSRRMDWGAGREGVAPMFRSANLDRGIFGYLATRMSFQTYRQVRARASKALLLQGFGSSDTRIAVIISMNRSINSGTN